MQTQNSNATVIWISVISLIVISVFSSYMVWFNNDLKVLKNSNESIILSLKRTNNKFEKLNTMLKENNKIQTQEITLLKKEMEVLKKQKLKLKKQNGSINLLDLMGLKK